jgi:spermidine synthase
MQKHPGKMIYETAWGDIPIEVVDRDGERQLYFGTPLKQSAMALADPIHLVLPYSRFMMSGFLFQPDPAKVLLIGLGAGAMVRFLMHYTTCQLDVVELSPRVIEVAQRFFGLPEMAHLTLLVDDGNRFAARAPLPRHGHYDWILVDAYDQQGMADTVYAHTFFARCRQRLAPHGVLLANASRRNENVYQDVFHSLADTFDQQVAYIHQPGTWNTLIMGFRQAPSPAIWHRAGQRIASLERRLPLNFQLFHEQLRASSRRIRFPRLPFLSW